MILNNTQAKVFNAIVYLNRCTIGKIAQFTGMHRHSVKVVLNTLIEKELVKSTQESNKIYYSANNLELIKIKYLAKLDQIKDEIPPLKADYEGTKDTQTINTVSGKLGLRTVLVDEIIKGKEICAFNLSPIRDEYEEEYKANDIRRIQYNIPLKVLTAYNLTTLPLSKIKKTRKKSKIDIFVYANKLTIFYDDVETRIFTIKINEVAKLFQDIFNNNWTKS